MEVTAIRARRAVGEGDRFGRGPVSRVPDDLAADAELVGGDDLAGPTDRELAGIDHAADLDELTEDLWRHRVADTIDSDERDDVVNPAGLDIIAIEPHPRQRTQERPLDLQSLGGWFTGRA